MSIGRVEQTRSNFMGFIVQTGFLPGSAAVIPAEIVNPLIEVLCLVVGFVAQFFIQVTFTAQLLRDLPGGFARDDAVLFTSEDEDRTVNSAQ